MKSDLVRKITEALEAGYELRFEARDHPRRYTITSIKDHGAGNEWREWNLSIGEILEARLPLAEFFAVGVFNVTRPKEGN